MKKVTKADIQIEEKLYLPFLLGLLKNRKSFNMCKQCYKDNSTHTCCLGCNHMTNDFKCFNRNLNCTLWFCDRVISKLKFQDLMTFSLVASELIKKGHNCYRLNLKQIDYFLEHKTNQSKLKRKTYYGSLSKVYVNCFTGLEKLILKFNLFKHSIKLRIKTAFKGKIYTSK